MILLKKKIKSQKWNKNRLWSRYDELGESNKKCGSCSGNIHCWLKFVMAVNVNSCYW